MLGKIQHHISLNVKRSRRHSIVNTLYCDRNFTQYSHFETTVAKFLALEIRHLKAKVSYKVIINERGGGGGKVRRYKARKGSSMMTKHELLVVVSISV